MTIHDTSLSPKTVALAVQLTAIRRAGLVSAHHGVALAQEDLPAIVEAD